MTPSAAAPSPLPQATVYLVEDEASVREALTTLLTVEGYQVLAFASGEAFLAQTIAETVGCIVLDMRLGSTSALELLGELKARGNALPVLILSAYCDVAATVRAMRAGASDYLIKSRDPAELLQALRERISAQRKRSQQPPAARDALLAALKTLTPRERQVLALAADGLDGRETASRLNISYRTVESHRSHIANKLNVDTLSDFFRLAVQHDVKLFK